MLPEGIRVPGCVIKPATERTWQPGLGGVDWKMNDMRSDTGCEGGWESLNTQKVVLAGGLQGLRGSTPSTSEHVGRGKHSSRLAPSRGRS